MSKITNKQMKASIAANLKDFKVAGVKSYSDNLIVSFTALARGRIVEWNKISGQARVPVARVAAKDFGPQDLNVRNVSWHVHIMRGGKEVTRGMKPTPRKNAIHSALHGALGYAIPDIYSVDDFRLDSGPASGPQTHTNPDGSTYSKRTGNEQEARVADKQAKQAAARKKTHEIGSPKIVNKAGKPLPKGVEALTIPEFLQRTVQ